MRAGIELHGDFDAVGLRALAKAGKDAAQSRRLLALTEFSVPLVGNADRSCLCRITDPDKMLSDMVPIDEDLTPARGIAIWNLQTLGGLCMCRQCCVPHPYVAVTY